MTINELIKRLEEFGDEKYRDNANVRILGANGEVIVSELNAFDVKDGVKSVDFYIPY